jgi:hypothetical protein
MRKIAFAGLLLTAAAITASAQQWEFGGVGGTAFLNTVPVSGASGSGTAGFSHGAVFGGYLGQNISSHIAGEIRYEYMQDNLSLSSGGSNASFAGVSHALHYDLLFHTNRLNSHAQLFAAIGGGMKIFDGTGTEAAYQPLSQFGYFTKTQTLKPMGDFGGGVRIMLSKHVFLRAEVRDFITAFPTQVLTPPPGVKYSKLLHDVVPMAGLSYAFGPVGNTQAQPPNVSQDPIQK